MFISRLVLQDFRSYDHWEIEPDSALTILAGPNAIGKTNIIEAIQLVATGSSFRTTRWEELVRWGAESAALSMNAVGEGSVADVTVTITEAGVRAWRVGGVVKRRAVDATRFVPVVTFTPDDLALVKGPAEQRRSTIDTLGEQLSATYTALKRDYARVIRQRNTLLRDEGPSAALAPWDAQVVSLGARLHVHRRGLAKRVLDAAAPVFSHLAGQETLEIQMVDRCGIGEPDLSVRVEVGEVERALQAELSRRVAEERARKVTLVGPHRDDIVFLIDGKDARSFASQGQQRTIALTWKWAEIAVVGDVLGRQPVLLLDDVMSELDATRRAALTDLVQQEIQTFVTTTTTTYFDPALLRAARVVTLSGARS